MPTTKLVLDADEQKILQAFRKVHKSQDKTSAKAGELLRHTKKTETQMGKLGSAGSAAIGALGASAVSVGGIVAGVSKGIREDIEQLKYAAETARKLASDLATKASGAGDQFRLPAVRAVIEQTQKASPTVTPTQAASIYDAVRGQLPNADLRDVGAVSVMSSRASLAGIPNVEQFAQVMAEQHKLDRAVSLDDQADATKYMLEGLGIHAPKLTGRAIKPLYQLKEAGIDSETSNALLMATLKSRQSPELLQEVGKKLTQQAKQIEATADNPLTQAQMLSNQFFATADPTARLKTLMQNKDMAAAVLGDTYSLPFAAMMQESPDRIVTEMKAAKSSNLFQRSVSATASDPEIAAAMMKEVGTAREEELQQSRGKRQGIISKDMAYEIIERAQQKELERRAEKNGETGIVDWMSVEARDLMASARVWWGGDAGAAKSLLDPRLPGGKFIGREALDTMVELEAAAGTKYEEFEGARKYRDRIVRSDWQPSYISPALHENQVEYYEQKRAELSDLQNTNAELLRAIERNTASVERTAAALSSQSVQNVGSTPAHRPLNN